MPSAPVERVWLARPARGNLVLEGNLAGDLETGGLLVGYVARDAVITRIIGPGPKAMHLRDRFVPDYDYQEAAVAEIYHASRGSETYLGDWHTHPSNGLYLSPLDVSTLKRIARDPSGRASRPLMLVASQQADGVRWDLGVWQYAPRWFSRSAVARRPLIVG